MISGSLWNSRAAAVAPAGNAAERRADLGGVAARGIALVEDQVDHRGDGSELLAALDRARGLERNAGTATRALAR